MAAVGAFLTAAVCTARIAQLDLMQAGLILLYGACCSILMDGLGLIGGMWSKKFDDMALISNFLIMPLTFLSGVFYSVKQLPPLWQQINDFNPFFYLIDGFRYGFIGVGDTNPMTAIWVVLAATLVCMVTCWYLWLIGWKLKE